MAYDIMTPLLLVPDLTTLYAIDLVDSKFTTNNTWKSQKKEIRQILLDGNDKNTYTAKLRKECDRNDKIYHLKTKSIIIEDNDNENKWLLKFVYNGIERNLIYYHHRNYWVEWPSEIKDITNIMTMGAKYWSDDDKVQEIFLKMLQTRTTYIYYFYALTFLHEYFPMHIKMKRGSKLEQTNKIARIDINKSDSLEWIMNILDYERHNSNYESTDSDEESLSQSNESY